MELAKSSLGTDGKQVQLGMPGAWALNSSESSDHYTTKVGGLPDWPASVQQSLLTGERLKCAVCGSFLGLVVQVHAPLTLQDGTQWNERTIYIFGCPAAGCGLDPACWRTIRVQKEPTMTGGQPNTAEVNCPSLEISGNASGSGSPGHVVVSSTDWWDENDLWGGENLDKGTNGTQQVEEFMNFKDLESALVEAGRLAAEVAHEESHIRSDKGVDKMVRGGDGGGHGISSRGTDMQAQNLNFLLPVIPCFYIYFQAESISQETISTSSSSSPSPSSSSPQEALQTTTVHAIGGTEHYDGEVWEGEEYEPDRALHAGRTYLRFKKHLDHNQEQCLRYCFGGQVLWALEEVREAPGKCVACGGPRVYEMQLMPPLLYFLQQATNKDSAPGSYSPDEWDWFTLIVFTCLKSCSQKESDDLNVQKADWSIVEEATILQQEATTVCSFGTP